MAENSVLQQAAAKGIDIIWAMRIIEEEQSEHATVLAFQTEGELTESRDADSKITKSMTLRIPGTLETEGSMTAIWMRGDVAEKKFKQALRRGKKVGFWMIDSMDPDPSNSDKFMSEYFEGYLTERGMTFAAEDFVEMTYSFGLEGEGQEGYATLTKEQQAVVQYVFKDTTPLGETTGV